VKTLEETAPAEPVDWSDAQIGRYKFRRLVGSGGMGVVVAAHDPELDREVAIKIIAGDEAERPIREAQAMAKLSHPNVVQVYEVIRLGDRTAIVMELVEGEELGAWQQDRPWREIIDAYAQACRGLAAAHREGIVHRDFKPSNALVDRDGVVRVSDFGLAHASADAPLDSAGTPAYMAPEQHRKGTIDARTDQWSVACALYEALYGKRPFEDQDDLAAAVIRGELPPDGDSPVPRRVRAAIRRALSPKPDDRFETIEAFSTAITWKPRTTTFVLAAAALVIAGLVITLALTRRSEAAVCEGLDAPISAVWTSQMRAELRAKLLDTKLGIPPATVDKTLRGLDAYAAAWTTTRTNACLDTQQGVRSTEILDTRMRCLDHRLSELGGLLEGLATGNEATLRRANDAVAQLRSVSACSDATESNRPTDPVLQQQIEVGETAVARAIAMMSLAQYDRALPLASQAVTIGDTTNATSLMARGLVVRGECEDRLGRPIEASATYQRAASVAAKAREHVVLADALSRRFFVEGDHLGHRKEAAQMRPFIELAIESAGSPEWLRAAWLHLIAGVENDDPKTAKAAVALARESLAIRQRTLPPDHADILDSLETLANAESALGNFDEAKRIMQRILETRLASRGRNDYTVSAAYNNLGSLEIRRNDQVAALVYLEPAVEIARTSGQPNWSAVLNLGLVQLDLGRYRAAAKSFEEAVELAKPFGDNSAHFGESLVLQGIAWIEAGEVVRGRPLFLRGIEVARRSGSPIMMLALSNAVLLALRDRDPRQAHALFDEATKSPPNDPGPLALAKAELARAEAGCAKARPLLVTAIELGTSDGGRFVQTHAKLSLAECELELGDHAAARTRLETELASLIKAGADEVILARTRAAIAKLRN
jgi:tetratricopeptide (TPR) repeat protein